MLRKWESNNKELIQKCIEEVTARLEEIDNASVGIIAAQDIIDIVTEHLGPEIYDSGVRTAKKLLQERFHDLEIDLDLLEQHH
jgi:uncharacterized protein (DUF2164 family)